MNKHEFLEELKKELEKRNVSDTEDIISEYEDHFAFKAEEGRTEEEIAKKLSSPKEIAEEYAEFASEDKSGKRSANGFAKVGIVAVSIPLAAIYALMLAAVIALGAFAVCTAALGFCLLTTVNIAGLIPYIPYLPSIFIAVACFGLALLSAIGTLYAFMYVKQWRKCYFRWCKNMTGACLPSLSAHPAISKRRASTLKLLAMLGLIIFISAFVVGYVLICAYAGSLEPWHVWNWFVS